MSTASPLWLSTDIDGSKIKNLTNKKTGEIIPGKFGFLWKPEGMREGNYIIRWNYKLEEKTRKRHSKELFFVINPDVDPIKNIHARYTPKDKYQMLLEKYLPTMYKNKVSDSDLTPYVVENLNKSIAEGFTIIEDYANQLIDILDANFTYTGVLPLLANMFNIKLRSDDTTLWRRQIKQAIPLYKTKGTLAGLQAALDQAGIKLHKLTLLWQVVSPSIWTDGFLIKQDRFSSEVNDSIIGQLSKKPINENEIEVELRSGGDREFIKLPMGSLILASEVGEPTAIVWNGESLENPIELFEGDYVKIKYKHNEAPESIQKYIDDLPLADQRDEVECGYPLKNWNVKLIEEDDPLFDIIISERHPFQNPVVFGKVRTSFLYSENVYNMETYNGSLRDSLSPCEMDRDFIDHCSFGQSSKFNVYIEIEKLSDDRILEAKQIIKEYSPFHAILHKMNISGKITEFILSPVERIESDIKSDEMASNKEFLKTGERITCRIRWKDGREESREV